MVLETVWAVIPRRIPLRNDGLVNRVRQADSAVCEGLVYTSAV
jgi:hypothetical protein